MLLLDAKRRRYLVTLAEGGEFHSHAGFVPHADIVGAPEGVVVRSTRGAEYTVLRPTLEDFVVEMPRGAQVIYPKDLGADLHARRHRPRRAGVRVRRRVGRAVDDDAALRAPTIVGYELREDFANRAAANVRSFLGEAALDRYHVELARQLRGHRRATDRSTGSCSTCPSRGRSCPHAETVLRAGGILVAYTPSIIPGRAGPRGARRGSWIDARTIEVLHRGWHIEGQAVRPDHRMVAHTGFLTVARFLGALSRRDEGAPRRSPRRERDQGSM